MKHICALLISVLCLVNLSLEARTVQEASAVASAFMQMRGEVVPAKRLQRAAAATSVTTPVDLAFTQYHVDKITPAVYVFNSSQEGFVLVSAEDNARAVLGYSDNGTFDANNIPENMQFWLQMYANEMAASPQPLPKGKGAIGRKVVGKRQEASATTYPTVSPILGNTVWGQGEPFNNMCPQINGQRAVTGCVATALSQIMYAHKYPTQGIGSKSYTTDTKEISLSADFGATTYNWANMIPNYNNRYNIIQATAVATLMYHVGVAASMDYDVGGSGAVSSIALAAMTEYFGYDKAINVQPKDFMKEETILQTIATDLQAGRPVYISGATVNNEGHAFVCDGMKSDGYLHINWGWYGNANGYFTLSALDPENQGVGGSASDLAFTERVSIYSNIKPNEGGTAKPLVTIDKLIRANADTIGRNEKIKLYMDRFSSSGMATAKGNIYYFIYSNQQLVSKIEIMDFELQTGYLYTDTIKTWATLSSDWKVGEYEIEIRYIDTNGVDHPILVKGLGEVRIPFTITDSQFIFGNTPKPETDLRKIAYADISNISGTKIWKIDLFSSLFWFDIPSDKEVLISCYVYSDSETSVVGTYLLDATNSGKTGTIDNGAEYYIGYYNSCYSYTPTDLHLTILPGENGAMIIQYYMEVDGETMNHSFSTKPEWYSYDNNTDTYTYLNNYTHELAASLQASEALTLTTSFGHSNITEMSYFVRGIISNMRNTPGQIMQYTQARFDISDDGTTNNQFYCFNTKWLGNTDFVTGNEIQLGDNVVILGQLQNYQYNIPEIKGYIYRHNGITAGLYSITLPNNGTIYDIMGRLWKNMDNLPAGMYIIDGQKVVITR